MIQVTRVMIIAKTLVPNLARAHFLLFVIETPYLDYGTAAPVERRAFLSMSKAGANHFAMEIRGAVHIQNTGEAFFYTAYVANRPVLNSWSSVSWVSSCCSRSLEWSTCRRG